MIDNPGSRHQALVSLEEHGLMRAKQKLHPGKLTLFGLLGLADLVLTWRLVRGGHGAVYESNPVAGAWLDSYGWPGLAVFKVLAMLLVGLSILYVSFHRPRIGGRLLMFGCVVTAGVVAYSCFLMGFLEDIPPHDGADEAARTEYRGCLLDRELSKEREYVSLIHQLGQDLMTFPDTLEESVRRLAQTEKCRDHRWLRQLQRSYPERSEAECLALHIGYHTLGRVQDARGPWEPLAEQLEVSFQLAFGKPAHFHRESSAVLQMEAMNARLSTALFSGRPTRGQNFRADVRSLEDAQK